MQHYHKKKFPSAYFDKDSKTPVNPNLYEVVVKHAIDNDEVTIAIPAKATVRDVKKALLEKLGWGDMSRVHLVLKNGSTFAKHLEDQLVWTKNEQQSMNAGIKFKTKCFHALGVNFHTATEDASEVPDFETASSGTLLSHLEQYASPWSTPPQSPLHSPRTSDAADVEEMDRESFRIALMTNGSREDVQSMIALARALEDLNHAVSLFVPRNLMDLCKEYAVNAMPVFGDSQISIKLAGGLGGFAGAENVTSHHQVSGGPQKEMEKWLSLHPGSCFPVDDALADFKPHVIVLGCLCHAPAFHHEQTFGVPVIPLLLNRQELKDHDYKNLSPPRPILYAVDEEVDAESLGEGQWLTRVGPIGLRQRRSFGSQRLQEFLREEKAATDNWNTMQAADIEKLAYRFQTAMKTDMLTSVILPKQGERRAASIIDGFLKSEVGTGQWAQAQALEVGRRPRAPARVKAEGGSGQWAPARQIPEVGTGEWARAVWHAAMNR